MPFGYKICWLAIRTGRAEDVVAILPIENVQRANWHTGYVAAYGGHVFVSPPVEDWVFVVSANLPALDTDANSMKWRELVTNVACKFREVQFFGTHRVSSYYAWARFRDGREERAFSYGDGQWLVDRGERTEAERNLGSNFFNENSKEAKEPGYWDRTDLEFPNEQYLMKLAAEWSINPQTLGSRNESLGKGWIATLRI
jgi:hypothetical protein